MSLVWNFKTSRVGVYKCFMSLSKIERKFFVFVGILEKGIEMRCEETITVLHVASHIAIHNWVIHVQHFKTKGGFPPPRNFSVRTRVKKNRGYVWKATQKRKSWTSLNSYVYARPFIHCLYFIYVRKIYQSSHRKLTRQWKSTLTDLINREGTVVYSVRAVGRSVVRLPASCSLHRRHRRVAITETTCLT